MRKKKTRMPKCCCGSLMKHIFMRVGGYREQIGYICKECNSYKIFKGPNEDGPSPRALKGDIHIGLKTITIEEIYFKKWEGKN